MDDSLIVGRNAAGKDFGLLLAMANRHGLITGATGTGKTVTLQLIAEQFSKAGICVFTADVKGDLSGLAKPAELQGKVEQRLDELGIKGFQPSACFVNFWDIYGKLGHPMRATISELGPLLLGRLLALNDTQQSVLNAAFSYADDQQLLLIDLKDLLSLITWIGDHAAELKSKYGNLPAASLSTIQRGLINLQQAGGEEFFGEPAFNIKDLLQFNDQGQGVITVLDATKLIQDSRMYSTFLLWLLSELFDTMPEVGDLDKPKLVFFFDEAHLFFDTAPKALLEKIEQLVRLIRSKGVGVYFITQNPLDVPESVLGQLGNRVQHALRAFTLKDQKAVKAAAETFRTNPQLNVTEEITHLGVGEALISCLDAKGSPGIVEKVKIMLPQSKIGAISATDREQLIHQSKMFGKYEERIDRESAFERLASSTDAAAKEKETTTVTTEPKRPPGRPRQSATETLIKSTARSVGSQLGKQIMRGILGSMFGKK